MVATDAMEAKRQARVRVLKRIVLFSAVVDVEAVFFVDSNSKL